VCIAEPFHPRAYRRSIQICSSQPFKRREPPIPAKLDVDEAVVTALLAMGMVLLAAVTIMIFF
jgi:hypothetical protein